MNTNATTVSTEDDKSLPAIVVDGVQYVRVGNGMEEEAAGDNAVYWETRARIAFLDCIKRGGYEKRS